jgi:C1A family cysteine protease
MRFFLILFTLLSQPLFSAESFTEGDNWVVRYLKDGGSINDVTGLKRPHNWRQGAHWLGHRALEGVELPVKYDLREKLGTMQPIRNQGSCGSCWAFASTAVIEGLLWLKNGGQVDTDLAEQTLVSNCFNGGSCGGGYFTALNYIRDHGLPAEADDPYLARNSRCKNMPGKAKIANWAYVGSEDDQPTTEEIKKALVQYGPVVVDVNASFSGYSHGVYDRCNTGGTNHMMTIEGYDDTDGKGFWIVRNSWGADWGEKGYLRIRYENSRHQKCNGLGRTAAVASLPL